jgi:hypothetical protein
MIGDDSPLSLAQPHANLLKNLPYYEIPGVVGHKPIRTL